MELGGTKWRLRHRISIDDTTPLLYLLYGLSRNDYASRDNCHAVLIHCAIAVTAHMRYVTTRLDDYSKVLS